MSQKDYLKGSLYYGLAFLRTEIDIEASNDSTVQDIRDIFREQSAQMRMDYITTPKEEIRFKKEAQEAFKALIVKARAIGWKYDNRWPSTHSLGAFSCAPLKYVNDKQYQEIVKRVYEDFERGMK